MTSLGPLQPKVVPQQYFYADDIGRALLYFPRLNADTNCVPCFWIIIQKD